ncbi:hypothetical protein ACIQPR_46785 [Streptomyces sp. NPDC091280]|uniref:hypothetical protein n=1 Tax=Streptomyces sp. NPDC091280 TaxID=3365984 RepID=UPI00382B1E19
MVEGEPAGVARDNGRLTVHSPDGEGRQALPDALVVVGDVAAHVLLGEECLVVSAARRHRFEEGAEFGACSPVVVEQAPSARWPLGRSEPVGEVIPEEITQPSL